MKKAGKIIAHAIVQQGPPVREDYRAAHMAIRALEEAGYRIVRTATHQTREGGDG